MGLFYAIRELGWVIAMIANPVVRWLGKAVEDRKESVGSAIIIVMVLGLIVTGTFTLDSARSFNGNTKIFID